jgi:hypothetical protein
MASNKIAFVGHARIKGAEPYRVPGSFAAGASQAVKQGEILILSGGLWAPLGSDTSMSGVIAVADCEIRSGDLAGYRPIIVPGEDDLFVFDLASANSPAIGDAVYYSSSQAVALTGSNVLGYVAGFDHYPMQGFQSVDASPDVGTTKRTVSSVVIRFKKSVSYLIAIAV